MLEKKIGKILVVDDEPHNVEALLDFFQRNEVGYDYVDCIDSAVELMVEAYDDGFPYGLLIVDNHFCDSDLVAYDPNFNGVDLVGILAGNVDLDDNRGMGAFVRDYFGERFEEIQEQYAGRLLMFSGSAKAEDPELLRGVEVVQKFPDEDGVCCEQGILEAMEERGFVFNYRVDALQDYKLANGLCDGVAN